MGMPIILKRMLEAENSLKDALSRITVLENELILAKDRIFALENTSTYNILNPYSKISGLNVYKMQPHCHTSPESNDCPKNTYQELANAYVSNGYNAICITNHDVITTRGLGLCDSNGLYNGMLILNGIEEQLVGNRHLSVLFAKRNVGTAEDVGGSKGSFTSAEALNMHIMDNAYIGWAHPTRENGSNFNTIFSLPAPNFIEIVNANANTNDEVLLDRYLAKGIKVHAMGSDDCHDVTNSSKVNKAWINVYADALTEESIKESIIAGRYYTSTGNDIEISMSKDKITVSSTEESIIETIVDGEVIGTFTGKLTSYILNGNESFIRFRSTLKSDTSKKAYTNAILLLDNFNV